MDELVLSNLSNTVDTNGLPSNTEKHVPHVSFE